MKKQTLMLLGLVACGFAAMGEVWVSPQGDDRAEGAKARPVRSLARALELARAEKGRSAAKPACIRLTAGDHALAAPLALGAADSHLVWQGEKGARITGAIALSGWTDRGAGVWGAKLPQENGKAIYTETLFVNGRRAQRSRFPADGGFFRIAGVKQVAAADSPTGNRVLVQLKPGERAAQLLAATSAEELANAQLLAHIKWDVARYPIRSVKDGVLAVDGQPMKPWNGWTVNDFFALENVSGAFTEAGQWFYDAKAGEILYRPLPGEKIAEAVVPRDGQENLVVIKGATNVVFKGVGFAYSAPVLGKGCTRLAPFQAAAGVSTACVLVDQAKGVRFDDCRFEHLGSYAVWFREGVSDSSVKNCELTDLGAGGVRIGSMRSVSVHGVTNRPADCKTDVAYVETAPWMTHHIEVDNCLIAHGGRFHPAGVGILLTHASDCKLTHNDIFDLYYTGVSVGWVWGYGGSPSQRNLVGWNHIYNIGQRKLADMGGIYTLGTSFGTRLVGNLIHDIHTYSYGGWGLYPDEGSEGIVLEDNIVYNTDDASFHQHYGKDNILRNNILIDSKAGQIAVSRIEPHRSLTATNNIILWTSGDAFNRYHGTKSEKSKIDWRGNLWWRTDGKESFNGTPFAAWRQRIKDEGSVFADPGFVDWQKRDFRLKPDSPAIKAGFRPIDPSQAGRIKGRR